MSHAVAPETPAKQLAGFVAKFDPAIRKLARNSRTVLRKRLPTAIELVYDNFQALAIGYCSTERMSDCILSLAIFPKGVSLSFFYGAALPDPHGILEGSGSQNRFVRLETAETLLTPDVEALITAAIAQGTTPLAPGGSGYTVIKSISARQRPRSALA